MCPGVCGGGVGKNILKNTSKGKKAHKASMAGMEHQCKGDWGENFRG